MSAGGALAASTARPWCGSCTGRRRMSRSSLTGDRTRSRIRAVTTAHLAHLWFSGTTEVLGSGLAIPHTHAHAERNSPDDESTPDALRRQARLRWTKLVMSRERHPGLRTSANPFGPGPGSGRCRRRPAPTGQHGVRWRSRYGRRVQVSVVRPSLTTRPPGSVGHGVVPLGLQCLVPVRFPLRSAPPHTPEPVLG